MYLTLPKCQVYPSHEIFNRLGVARAVLKTPLSLIKPASQSSLWVMCHMSGVRCQVSCVRCPFFLLFLFFLLYINLFSANRVILVDSGGSVINGATRLVFIVCRNIYIVYERYQPVSRRVLSLIEKTSNW